MWPLTAMPLMSLSHVAVISASPIEPSCTVRFLTFIFASMSGLSLAMTLFMVMVPDVLPAKRTASKSIMDSMYWMSTSLSVTVSAS